ncbi:ribosome biogenesis protein Nop16 [Aureococcus anophagefferens]|nr:ribosome biogenesis protein Nop16 [Aureococcus anophagefferens]
MKRLGLAHDVNRAVGKLPGAAPAGERVDQAVELEFAYIVKLMAKYGDDCAKMARDVKRNPQQLTEAKLRKMVAKYDGLSDKPPPSRGDAPTLLVVRRPRLNPGPRATRAAAPRRAPRTRRARVA